MLKAYRCVYFARYGKKARVDKKARYRLASVLKAFRRHGIKEPYAWAMFRARAYDYGRKQDGKSARPKIDSVFAASLVDAHAEWFFELRSMFSTPLGALPAASRELHDRWHKVRDVLLERQPQSRLEADLLVNETLPSDVYDALCTSAREQVATMNAAARRRLARGEWVWGLTT